MLGFFKKWQGLIIAVIAVINTLIAGYLTLAVERRPVDVPGLVLILPEDQEAIASIPEKSISNGGAGLLAVGLMGSTALGVGWWANRRRKTEDIPVEAQGIPGVIAKIALTLAIRFLEVRAPKTPGDLDDNILKLLIILRNSGITDLLTIQQLIEEAKASGKLVGEVPIPVPNARI